MSLEGYYKAYELENFGGRLKIKEKSFRNIHRDEILVKLQFTTVNSADVLFLKGEYGTIFPSVFPVIPGFEGIGNIIKVGEGIDKRFVGKRVTVLGNPNISDGLWAEYHYTTLSNVMVLDEEVEGNTNFLINPLISVSILDYVTKLKIPSVVQTDSPICQMLYKILTREGIIVVNLTKDNYTYKTLSSINACNIVRLTHDSEWKLELTKLCDKFNVLYGFSFLGGDVPGMLINAMPNDSTLFIVGENSGNPIGKISSSDLIFKDKNVRGWCLNKWMRSITQDETIYWWNFIQKEFKSKTNVFKSEICKLFEFRDVSPAIDYFNTNSEEGTILIKF